MLYFFFFNDTATTEIYTLSLHDALPIFLVVMNGRRPLGRPRAWIFSPRGVTARWRAANRPRSEEHMSELQSRQYLVCRLLLEKKLVLERRESFPYGPVRRDLPYLLV